MTFEELAMETEKLTRLLLYAGRFLNRTRSVLTGVADGATVTAPVGVSVGVVADVGDGVTFIIVVALGVGVLVGDFGVGVFVSVLVGLTVGVLVTVLVGLVVGVKVGVLVEVTVGVFV